MELHDEAIRNLDLKEQLTSFRVWINRSSAETLSALLGVGGADPARQGEDRALAHGQLASIRGLVARDPDQVARAGEIEALVDRRFAAEDAALAAGRASGPAAAAAALEASGWQADRQRLRTLTGAMLDAAHQGFHRREASYLSSMRQVRFLVAGGLILVAGTLLYLLRQLRLAWKTREDVQRANEVARQRLADLTTVLDTVPAAVFIAHDRECHAIRGNVFAEAMFRAPPGSNFSLSAPPGTRVEGVRFLRDGVEVPADELPVHRAARTGEKVDNVQLDLALDGGEVRHLLATAHPLRDSSGTVSGAVGAYVDVSDVIQVAHELRTALDRNRVLLSTVHRSELLHREMARSFPNGAIALYDHDLRFLIFDGTRFAISRDPATNVGRTLAEIFPPEIASRIEPVHREALQGLQGRIEVVINGRNVEIRTSPVHDDTGAVILGIATSLDVTEDRALRMQLAVSSRLASLGTLVAGVAHEVNNPLAGTLGSLGAAIEDSRALATRIRDAGAVDREELVRTVEELTEVLLDAQVGGNRISRIVKDLALFGRPNPMRTRVGLGDVVTSSMRWLPTSVGTRATVHVDDLGAPDVHASAGQLEQVVVNLVTNGAFAIPGERRGTIAIRISTTPGGKALLEVQDDGKGIDAITLERIFDPFFTTRDVGHGMGLGLPICHAIVAAHGGTLTVTSTPYKGSTFRVELPPADAHRGSAPGASRV